MPKLQARSEETIVVFEKFESIDAEVDQEPDARHRQSFSKMLDEMDTLPGPLKSTECLFLAAKMVEEAAFSMVYDHPRDDVMQLFLVAAQLEREVQRVAGIQESKPSI